MTPSQHVAPGKFQTSDCVEACTHMQERLTHARRQASRSQLHFHKQQQHVLTHTSTFFTPRQTYFLYSRHDGMLLKQEQGRTCERKIHDTDTCMPQSLPAVSHLISGPEDITVCLPVPPRPKVSCLPSSWPTASIVCIWIFFKVFLPWKCETVS